MNKIAPSLKPLLAALVLGACSTSPTMPEKAWKIAPVETVRHGGGNVAAGHFALGRYREGQRAIEPAIAAYRKALDADPDYAAAWDALGTLQVQIGRVDEGLRALERAVSLAPAASHLHNNLGYARLVAGDPDAAAASLRRAIELDDGNRRAWSNLATAYRRLGMPDKAELADARASGSWPAAEGTPPAPSVATALASPPAVPTPAGTAPKGVTVSPVSMDNPAATPVPVPVARTLAPQFGHAIADGNRPPARIATTGSGPALGTTPRAMLVKIAENVYELHNTYLKPAATVAEAAAIITAAAPPSAPAPVPAPPPPREAATRIVAAPASTVVPVETRPARYEISNGHGGEGLARRLAGQLAQQGIARARLTNTLPYDQPTSFVEYRAGYREAAEAFATHLPFRPTILATASTGLSADVRLMLGHDLTTSEACDVLGVCGRIARTPAPKLALVQAAVARD
jgi:Tfp pilus assembly protein PilF